MQQHFRTKGLAVLLMGIQLAGCSTLFGRHQDEQLVFFDANIEDVEVTCEGKRTNTPGSMTLRQSRNHSCVAEKPGYRKEVVEIRSGVSWSGFTHSAAFNTAAWGWWTLGIGTGVGLLIDFPSGAMKNLKEDHVEFRMRPLDEPEKGAKGEVKKDEQTERR